MLSNGDVSKIHERVFFILTSAGAVYAAIMLFIIVPSDANQIEPNVTPAQSLLLVILLLLSSVVAYYYHKTHLPRRGPSNSAALIIVSVFPGLGFFVPPIYIYRIYKLPKLVDIMNRMRSSLREGETHLQEGRYEEAISSFEDGLNELEEVGSNLDERSLLKLRGILVSKGSVNTEVVREKASDLISEIKEKKQEAERRQVEEEDKEKLPSLIEQGDEELSKADGLVDEGSHEQASKRYIAAAESYDEALEKAQNLGDADRISEIETKLKDVKRTVEGDCLNVLMDKIQENRERAWTEFDEGNPQKAAKSFRDAYDVQEKVDLLENLLDIQQRGELEDFRSLASVSEGLHGFRAKHSGKTAVRFEEALREQLTENKSRANTVEDAIEVSETALNLDNTHSSYPFENIVEGLAELAEDGELTSNDVEEYRKAVDMSDKILSFLEDVSHDHPSVSTSDWKDAVHTALENGSSQVLRPPVKRIDRMGDELWNKEYLHVFSPEQFEYLVGTLYEDMGYEAAVTQKSSDAGVDVWAQRNGERVAIQVKQNSEGNTVGRPVLQKISSTIAKGDADQAVVVTSSSFANTAETYGSDFGANMELVDGDKLVRMLSESDVPPPVAEA